MLKVPMKVSGFVALIFTLFCAVSDRDCRAEELVLDHRTYTDASGIRYFVVIVARGGSPTGHAFVVWGMEDPRRGRSVQRAFGFYPKSGTGAFGNVPGQIVNEALNPNSSLITDRVVIEVNRQAFLQSMKSANKWATKDFNLYSSNCISFVREVAQRTNTKIPAWNILDYPSTHVRKIIAKNR